MTLMTQTRLEIRPLSPALGAEVLGVDLAGPLDDGTVRALRAALLEHVVIFCRDQELAPPQLLALAERFGEVAEYPFVKGLPDFPLVLPVVKEAHERANFGGVWHTDTAYLERPAMATLLYALETPPVGGDTMFANMYLAYEALSEGMQRLLGGLRAVNVAGKATARQTREEMHAKRGTAADVAATSAVHPVVRTHPETGRRALYVNLAHTVRFEGMTEAESAPLLDYLFAHQIQPEFTCRFAWRPGSLALWDNRASLHYPLNDYHGHRRVMHRVSIAGDRPR
ncbi:MAG TPA: TauD/TfdA family dioxygenase [Geminicoccaceae bacterium]|nr:TauD/TfdA family dioxygenase [Geminicoccaceae bacterium]